jgi:hypothetical protein
MLANTEPGYSVASAMNEGNRQRCRPPRAVIGFHLTHCLFPFPSAMVSRYTARPNAADGPGCIPRTDPSMEANVERF